MPVLRTKIDTASETYLANRQGLLDLLAEHDEQVCLLYTSDAADE